MQQGMFVFVQREAEAAIVGAHRSCAHRILLRRQYLCAFSRVTVERFLLESQLYLICISPV